MTPIQPVHEGDTGPKVTALHVGLIFLIGHQGNPPNVQQTLLAKLAPDVTHNVYGEPTRHLFGIYQLQLKNWPNYWTPPKLPQDIVQSIPANCPGDVDKGTAKVLNWFVETFRRMASPPPPRGNCGPPRYCNNKGCPVSSAPDPKRIHSASGQAEPLPRLAATLLLPTGPIRLAVINPLSGQAWASFSLTRQMPVQLPTVLGSTRRPRTPVRLAAAAAMVTNDCWLEGGERRCHRRGPTT